MWHEPSRRSLCLHFGGRLTERERLGLSENICQKKIMVAAQRIQGLCKCDEVAGNEFRSLVYQLIEGVLSVSPGLAPIDRSRLSSDFFSVESDVFAVTLHRQLLQVCGKPLEILLVGQHGDSLSSEEIVVPHSKKAHEYRQIALEWRGAEVLVDLVEAFEHRAKMIRADGHHR